MIQPQASVKQPKELRPYRVYAIEEGTVIDHIPGGKALQVIDILGLAEYDGVVTVGINLESSRLGKKDIVKIERKELTKAELDKIALIAPEATINIIKNFEKASKFTVDLPAEFSDVIRCPNTNCITNHEQMVTRVLRENGKFSCFFCEMSFSQDQLELL